MCDTNVHFYELNNAADAVLRPVGSVSLCIASCIEPSWHYSPHLFQFILVCHYSRLDLLS